MTPQELVNKIDWEGGTYEAITGYGLAYTDLDNATPAQYKIWSKVVRQAVRLREAIDEMNEVFPEVGTEENEDE